MAAVVPEPVSCKWVLVGSGSLPDALPSVSALAIAERDGIGHSLLHLSPGSAPMVLAASASACAASAPVAADIAVVVAVSAPAAVVLVASAACRLAAVVVPAAVLAVPAVPAVPALLRASATWLQLAVQLDASWPADVHTGPHAPMGTACSPFLVPTRHVFVAAVAGLTGTVPTSASRRQTSSGSCLAGSGHGPEIFASRSCPHTPKPF